MYFWISWVQPTDDYRPMSFPPNDSVMGWWCSGSAENGATLCAMVKSDSEQNAQEAIRKDWPEAQEWRFCEPKTDLELGDRFPLNDWMKPRFAAEQH